MPEETANQQAGDDSGRPKRRRSRLSFRKKKKDDSSVNSSSSSKKGKSKTFKRIKGVFSRKKSKRSDTSFDASVQVDETSMATARTGDPNSQKKKQPVEANADAARTLETGESSPTTDTPAKKILQVILLLMDPSTRKFELLQLQFDHEKTVVADVLAQIPKSVTDEGLRDQDYYAVADRLGTELINNVRLNSFCQGNEVLVAVPKGLGSKDCALMAKPILSDPGICSMLRMSGVNVDGWAELKTATTQDRSLGQQQQQQRQVERPASNQDSASSLTRYMLSFLIVAVLAYLLQVVHVYVSSPVQPGKHLSPGVWISKCGLLGFLPSCENAYVQMGRDGALTFYDSKHQVQWRLVGDVCSPTDYLCKNGLVMTEDGKVVIGGRAIHSITVFGEGVPAVSPWPFLENPHLRMIRGYQ